MMRWRTCFAALAMASVLGMASVLVSSCSKVNAEENADDTSLPDATEVTSIYGHYINADFDAYVGQMEPMDHATPEYRQQMMALFKQRYRSQVEENGGPIACRVIDMKPNADKTYVEVFLEVTFKDRSFEEIMLPMVRIGDTWRLR